MHHGGSNETEEIADYDRERSGIVTTGNRRLPVTSLTEKQKQVCDLIADGLSNKEIADRIGISPRTVEEHRAAVFKKHGVRNAVQLVRKTLGAAE